MLFAACDTTAKGAKPDDGGTTPAAAAAPSEAPTPGERDEPATSASAPSKTTSKVEEWRVQILAANGSFSKPEEPLTEGSPSNLIVNGCGGQMVVSRYPKGSLPQQWTQATKERWENDPFPVKEKTEGGFRVKHGFGPEGQPPTWSVRVYKTIDGAEYMCSNDDGPDEKRADCTLAVCDSLAKAI